MKKKLKKHLILLPIIILASALLLGCFKSKFYNLTLHKLSEIRQDVLVGENELIDVNLVTGFREKDYIINGYSTNLIEFGVLSFSVLDEKQNNFESAMFSVVIDGKRHDGELEKNPFNNSWVADLKVLVSPKNLISAKIIAGEFVSEVALNSVTKNWKTNYKDALKIACKELESELETFLVDGEFDGEGYVKIINDKEMNKNNFYWYVNFVSKSGKNVAIVIDPNTKEIMAKQNF